MLCCSNVHPSYAPVDTGVETQKEPTDSSACSCLESLSDFPGCRRIRHDPVTNNRGVLVSTLGNALVESDPNGGEVVRVTVPDGSRCGQNIQVAAPDGTGRIVSATIPSGMQPGSTFTIQLPPATEMQDGDVGKPAIVTGIPVDVSEIKSGKSMFRDELKLHVEPELELGSVPPTKKSTGFSNRSEDELQVKRGEMT